MRISDWSSDVCSSDLSGLVQQLAAADRALLLAYLGNGGLAFTGQYRDALGAYFTHLASGRRPSDYAALDAATLRAYLETLSDAGLLSTLDRKSTRLNSSH